MPKEVKGPDETTTHLAPKTSVKSLMTDQIGFDEAKADISKEAGEQMKEYKKDKHIDPWAFGVAKSLKKLKSVAMRVARVEHLKHYIETLKLDEGAPKLPGTPEAGHDITAEDLDEAGINETDADTVNQQAEEQRDLRPRHLRQPGASGADLDAAEVAAGGASVTPLNPKRRSTKDAADAAEAAVDKKLH